MLPCAVGPVIMSFEEKMEADARSIYVGNVSKRSNSFRCGGKQKGGAAVFSLKEPIVTSPTSLPSCEFDRACLIFLGPRTETSGGFIQALVVIYGRSCSVLPEVVPWDIPLHWGRCDTRALLLETT